MFIAIPIKNVQLTSAHCVLFDWQLFFKFRNKIICVSRHCFNFTDASLQTIFKKKRGGGVFVICSERNELKKKPEFVSLLQVLYHVHKFLFYEVYE